MVNKLDILLIVFSVLFLFSVFMSIRPYIGLGDRQITGFAASGSAVSNVTISKNFAITLSTNLSNGIEFGNQTTATDANASDNYNGASNITTMFTNVSSDSTVNVDFCISANTHLTDPTSADIIGLGNETYANASSTSSSVPALGNQISLTTSDVKSGLGFTPLAGANYYRFWLDVPATTPSGTYNNSITFTGVEEGDSCP